MAGVERILREIIVAAGAALIHLDANGTADLADKIRCVQRLSCRAEGCLPIAEVVGAGDREPILIDIVDEPLPPRVPRVPRTINRIPRAPPLPAPKRLDYTPPQSPPPPKGKPKAVVLSEIREDLHGELRRNLARFREYERNIANNRRKVLYEAAGWQYEARNDAFSTLWVERKCDCDMGVPRMSQYIESAERRGDCIRLAANDIEGNEGDLRALFTREGYTKWTYTCIQLSGTLEKPVMLKMLDRVGGRSEVWLQECARRVDILTGDGKIIEVKRYALRYGAVDQLRGYGILLPAATLWLHLFDCRGCRDEEFVTYCRWFGIVVTFDTDDVPGDPAGFGAP